MPRLFILSGPEVGRTIDVEAGAVLGRGEQCAAQLRAPSISRKHAELVLEGDEWWMVDLGSRNGLEQAGQKMERVPLVDGTQLKIGDVEVRFRAAAPEAAPAPPPPPAVRETPPPVPEAEPDELELELEGDWDEEAARAATNIRPRPTTPAPAKPAAARAARPDDARQAAARREELLRGGKQVLQYSRVRDGGGVLATDLSQRPGWVRGLVYFAAVVLFVGLFYAAMKLTLGVRGKVTGDPAPEEVQED